MTTRPGLFYLYKRMACESHALMDRFGGYQIRKIESSNLIEIQIKKPKSSVEFKFLLSPDYPFKIPKLYVNDIDYQEMLQFSPTFYQKYLSDYDMEHPYFTTKLHNSRWSPAIHLIHIIQEYYDFQEKIERKVKERLVDLICEDRKIYCLEIKCYIKNFL